MEKFIVLPIVVEGRVSMGYIASVGIESKIIPSYAIIRMCAGVSPNDKREQMRSFRTNLIQKITINTPCITKCTMYKCDHCQADLNSIVYCLFLDNCIPKSKQPNKINR